MVFQIVLETIIFLFGICGLVLHSGLAGEKVRKDFFRYYTNLSNLFVTMFYLIRMVVRITGNYAGFFGRIVFSELWFYTVTMCIILTFGIFHFVLVPYYKKLPADNEEFKVAQSFSNYIVHYIVPLLSLLNWLIFAKKEEFNYIWALIWTIIPWIYVAYSLIRAQNGVPLYHTDSAYPYDFMDAGKHGWAIVARNCLLVMIVFVSVGFLLLFLRKLI